VLVRTARGAAEPQTAAFCFQALELLTIWPMVVAALGPLVTGLLLGMGAFAMVLPVFEPWGRITPDHGNGQAHGE
jgi:hypothetical protein